MSIYISIFAMKLFDRVGLKKPFKIIDYGK